jgi:hypothetical protein
VAQLVHHIGRPQCGFPGIRRNACHARQHRIGELSFWSARRIDPLNVALRLWTVSGDIKAGERTVFRARQQIDLATA